MTVVFMKVPRRKQQAQVMTYHPGWVGGKNHKGCPIEIHATTKYNLNLLEKG